MAHLHRPSIDLGSQPPPTTGRLIRWANAYDPFVSVLMLGRRSQLRQSTVALARIQPGEHVLEVGCGTGDVALAAHAHTGDGGRVAGIDPAPEMIAVARRKAQARRVHIDFEIGVIEALPFPDRSFDVVLSSLMMHHLPDALKQRGLNEIARVLKPGGRLVIVDAKRPAGRLSRIANMLILHGHLTTGVQDLAALVKAAGFSAIESGSTRFRMLGFVRASMPGLAREDDR